MVLAADDPEVQGKVRDPASVPKEHIFDYTESRFVPPAGAGWRCASCYAGRFKTMCFGLNAAAGDTAAVCCEHCGRPMVEVGWSIWVTYDQLPPSWQNTVTGRHGPKMLTLLRTKWPSAKLSHADVDHSDLPSV